jgi:hypothetical protein
MRTTAALVLALALGACASTPRTACAPGSDAMVHESIYFGMAKPAGGMVTLAEWRDFLAGTVTPRFPQGLTVAEASGQWRGADGTIVEEPSHVLVLLHADDTVSERAVVEIVAAYNARFRQEAVLRVRSAACASF